MKDWVLSISALALFTFFVLFAMWLTDALASQPCPAGYALTEVEVIEPGVEVRRVKTVIYPGVENEKDGG